MSVHLKQQNKLSSILSKEMQVEVVGLSTRTPLRSCDRSGLCFRLGPFFHHTTPKNMSQKVAQKNPNTIIRGRGKPKKHSNTNTSLPDMEAPLQRSQIYYHIPSYRKKIRTSPGEEPGREEGVSREPHPSIVYRDLEYKEKADIKNT